MDEKLLDELRSHDFDTAADEIERLRRCLRAIADNTGGWTSLWGVQQFARQALGE